MSHTISIHREAEEYKANSIRPLKNKLSTYETSYESLDTNTNEDKHNEQHKTIKK